MSMLLKVYYCFEDPLGSDIPPVYSNANVNIRIPALSQQESNLHAVQIQTHRNERQSRLNKAGLEVAGRSLIC
eukprot:6312199-Amphidinium_carterae.1